MNGHLRKHYLFLSGFIGFLITFIWGVLNQKVPLTNLFHASLSGGINLGLMQFLLWMNNKHENRNARTAFNSNIND